MSCRHDLANGTCVTCYPSTGTYDPGPESKYGPNLDGPGAVPKKPTPFNAKDTRVYDPSNTRWVHPSCAECGEPTQKPVDDCAAHSGSL